LGGAHVALEVIRSCNFHRGLSVGWAYRFRAINLGLLPGAAYGAALGINDAGQVVGFSFVQPPTPPPLSIPEPSTWAMMLAGFAGLAFAGYHRAKADGAAILAG
jgi:hypothetical protein